MADGRWGAPFGAVGRTAPLRASCDDWDRAHASRLLRILTINMHGRPVDLAKPGGALGMRLPGDAAATMIECDDEYHLANAQERRMRGLFECLDALPAH